MAITAACNIQDPAGEQPAAETVRVSFIAEDPGTRTVFTEPEGDSYPVLWQTGDKVKLFLNSSQVNPSSDQGVMAADPSADGKTARFEITLPDPGDLESFNYGALSPASAFQGMDRETRLISLSIPGRQTSRALSPDPEAMLLWAAAGPYGDIHHTVKLPFRHLTAYVKLSLTGLKGTLSEVELVSDRNLAGTYSHPSQTDPQDAGVALVPVSPVGKIRVAATDPYAVWFACAPSDWSGSTLQVTAVTSEGTFTKTVTFPSERSLRPGLVARFSVDLSEASGRTDVFNPAHIVFSFGAISDVHINSPSNAYAQKFTSALNQLKTRAAETDPDGLDAVVVAGDLTDTPSQAYAQTGYFKTLYEQVLNPRQVPMIYAVGNHDAMSGYRWNANAVMEAAVIGQVLGDDYFLTDLDPSMRAGYECRHNLVGGYHVLSLMPVSSVPVTYPSQAKDWLDATLQSLTAADPERYVFVNTHPMIENTCYGSLLGTAPGVALSDIWYSSSGDYWATHDLTSILQKYPQVVCLGGHLHFPLNDPRSFWQGGFTSLGCGSVRYMAIENGKYEDMYDATRMNDREQFSQGWLIQLDWNGNLRATALDFLRNTVIGTPYEIPYPQSDRSHLTRFDTGRALRNRAPVLNPDGIVMTTRQVGASTSTLLTWQKAADDEFVHHYVLEVSKDGVPLLTRKYLADFYLHPLPSGMKDTWTVSLGSLPSGTYEVKLTAYDSWDASDTCTRSCTVEGSQPIERGLYADIDFDGGEARDSKGKVAVSNMGATIAPVTVTHAGQSYSVPAMQAGASAYVQCQFSEIFTATEMAAFAAMGFSIETMFVDKAPGAGANETHGVFCGTQVGGWGLALRKTGVPYFIVGEGSGSNTWKSLDAASSLSRSELSHVICTYDPAGKTMKLYVNGVLSSTLSVTGVYHNGDGAAFNRFCLGADISLTTIPDYPCTDMIITDAKWYVGALDAAAVQAAYQAAVQSLNP